MEPCKIDNNLESLQLHILEEIKRISKNLEKLNDSFNEEIKLMWIEIATLKTKSGIFGLLGGCLITVPTLIFFYMSK